MNEDNDDFKNQMLNAGVKPLKSSQKHHEQIPVNSKANARHHVRLDQQFSGAHGAEQDIGGGGEMEWLGPNDIMEYRKAGIQHRLYRNLAQGRLPIGSLLDLHGMRVEPARHAVWKFVHQCSVEGVRCGLVVHGKGWHSDPPQIEEQHPEGKARLKSYVNRWLREIPVVLAFCSARTRDGGTGATYVLIKHS